MRLALPLLLIAVLVSSACGTSADTTGPVVSGGYTWSSFFFPGSFATGGRGINDTGEIAAYYQASAMETDTHALLLIGDVFFEIDPPGTVNDGRGMGINASQTVVGSYNGGMSQVGFTRSAGGVFTDVVYPMSFGTTVRGNNDAGDLAGEWDDAADVRHGFSRIGGTFAPVDVPTATSTRARDINNVGRIVGHFDDAGGIHGFLLSSGAYTTIDFPAAGGTLAGGINDAGVIVGVYIDAGTGLRRGYRFESGTFTPVDYPGAMETLPTNINNLGELVGEYVDAAGVGRGFVARPAP